MLMKAEFVLVLHYRRVCSGKRFCATTEVHSPRTNVQLSVEEKKLFLRALHHDNNRAAAGIVDDAIAHLPK